MAFVTETLRGEQNLFSNLRAAVRGYMARRAVYTRTFDELNALSDRDLIDLGIARSNIDVIAREVSSRV